ncbi:protein RIC-3 [Chanos chanos]|uniref:Protein RIC-3 n=1 Tax=Chanos chanos TaxID=29144 RepID=A0A6J2ULR4_CHACN|nr:protein RIC-3 [Chanos chanos]
MPISACQTVTLLSCMVLCVSLFLPKIFLSRGRKEVVQSEVGPGHFPPMRYGQQIPEGHDNWEVYSLYARPYNPEAFAKTKSTGLFSRSNLLGQVIPVYGFGIFLYILYIFFKLTSKDKAAKHGCRLPVLREENLSMEITDYELIELRARLKETEGVVRRRSKTVKPLSSRRKRSTRRREGRLRRRLQDISQVMQEGRSLEGVSPEMEAEEVPYTADWEGYPEETYPEYEVPCRRYRRYPSVILEEPDPELPTAEELAERMEVEEGVVEDKGEGKEVLDEEQEGCEESNVEYKCDEEEDEEEEDDEEDDEEEEDEDGEEQPCLPETPNMEEMEEREMNTFFGEREDRPPSKGRKQITFSGHRHVFHYPKDGTVGCKYVEEEVEEDKEDDDEDDEDEDEDDNDYEDQLYEEEEEKDEEERGEDDPLMVAESLGFNAEVDSDPEEQEEDLIDFLLTYQPENTQSFSHTLVPRDLSSGELRMRHKKDVRT